MRPKNQIFTSESVSEGHPDKLCDQVSDAILDAILKEDKDARVACETLAKTGAVIVAGEVRTHAWVDVEEIVRSVVTGIGYTGGDACFSGNDCAVINMIGKQSPDIAVGVDETEDHPMGAGDQGLMFGFACNDTPSLMPAPIHYAHKLVKRQADKRKSGVLPFLLPDAKSQVTLAYDAEGRVSHVDTVVLSTQHQKGFKLSELREAVIEEIIKPIFPEDWMKAETKFFINPTGVFEIGGPQGDCGLTGRKIIVDTYGGYARHGGGAFSGKDPSKVDRSAAYCARYIAKNLVASGLCTEAEVQLAYAIGVADPVSIIVQTFGTGKLPDAQLETLVREHFSLTPRGIIDSLQLLHTTYLPTASYGHFGREDLDLPWERTNKAEALRAYL